MCAFVTRKILVWGRQCRGANLWMGDLGSKSLCAALWIHRFLAIQPIHADDAGYKFSIHSPGSPARPAVNQGQLNHH